MSGIQKPPADAIRVLDEPPTFVWLDRAVLTKLQFRIWVDGEPLTLTELDRGLTAGHRFIDALTAAYTKDGKPMEMIVNDLAITPETVA